MSANIEFVIPLEKDDLLKERNNQFYVKKLISANSMSEALDETRTTLQNVGPRFIIQHFDVFFSVLIHGNKLAPAIALRAFDRIGKSLEVLVEGMEKKFPSHESRSEYLSVNKMHAYILCSLISYLEDTTLAYDLDTINRTNKKKKGAKKQEDREEWEGRRSRILLIIQRWLQLPLQDLWQPPIVEESFVQLIADICYKILEHDKDDRRKEEVRDPIFKILGTLVKNYLHKITCAIKIIQLVKIHETLAPYLATGVSNMMKTHECPTFINELVREIDQNSLEEASAKNISAFLEVIATDQPKLILTILPNIISYLMNECYSMRICGINVIAIVIQGALTREDLNIKERYMRDKCFDLLDAHMLDVNTYVRSRIFQILLKLCCEAAIPVNRYGELISAAILHLNEKAATVRKQVLMLLQTLLESNPFNKFIEKPKIAEQKAKMLAAYEKVQEEVVGASGSADEERHELWKKLSPEIVRAIKDYIDNHSDSRDLDDEEEREEEEEEDEEIDDEKYEEIRQLIINKNFKQAIKKVIHIGKMINVSLTNELQDADEEDFYYHIIFFIFMETSKDSATHEETNSKLREQKKKMLQIRKILHFLNNAEKFSTAIENAIEQLEIMLSSPTATSAIETSKLLAIATKLKIPGAAAAMTKAMTQVFSREESVRNNIADIYGDMYFSSNGENATVSLAVNALICLFKSLQSGQSLALAQLIAIWLSNKTLTEQHIERLWQKYTMKIPGTTVNDSRCAILLLALVGQTQPAVIIANVDVIIKIGLKPCNNQEILLARDSCRALLTIKTTEPTEAPVKRPNHDKLFTELFNLLTLNFATIDVEPYVSFATDAINVIYHLANQPGELIKKIVLQINNEINKSQIELSNLAKLLYIVGHSAIKYMAYLDTDAYKEMKRRKAILELKKGRTGQRDQRDSNNSVSSSASVTVHSSARKARQSIYRKQQSNADTMDSIEDAGEEALGGATADDADAEAIETELENNIVNGNGIFSYFVPIIVDVCQYPEKYKCPYVRAYGVQALAKMMSVSSKFCQQHLQLLITILERSNCPEIRSNILSSLADLMARFPNEVEPWTSHLYTRLRDPDVSVRSTAVRILASLVKREMIRAKEQMSEMALCIIDENEQVSMDAKRFFSELSQKGNVLYNILPDILSRLTSTNVDIEEDNVQKIVKHIFGLLQKERESDVLLNKIFQRLKMSVDDRQCRDLAYCLSLLQLGKKGIATLITNLPSIKNKLHIREVQRALKDIVANARKKPENKDISAQLENEIDRLLDSNEADANEGPNEDVVAMPPPMVPPKTKSSTKMKQKKQKNLCDDSEESDNSNTSRTRRSTRKTSSTDSLNSSNSLLTREESNSESCNSPLSETHGSETRRQSLRKTREKSFKEDELLPPKRPRANKNYNKKK